MKPGKEYEKFIYEKFREFFVGFEVNLNDKILGKLSGIKREIDVSVKGKVNDFDLLYIVQCKDHIKPADVKIIGEFSSVIKDLGASKGFLICSSGFTKTIHQYAKNLGIELITIEDINSTKWKAEIEIPILYIWKKLSINYKPQIKVTPELAERNKTKIILSQKDFEFVSVDNGHTSIRLIDYLNDKIGAEKIDITKITSLVLDNPNLLLKFAELWIPVIFTIGFETGEIFYLKYIKPLEYSQIINHVTKEIMPLKIGVNTLHFKFDDTFIEININDSPISSPVLIEVEENLYPINEINFDFGDITMSKVNP
jgi:hypothetical protein